MTQGRDAPYGSQFVPFDSEHVLGGPAMPSDVSDPVPEPGHAPIEYQLPQAWRLDPIETSYPRDTHRGLIAVLAIFVSVGLITGFLIVRDIRLETQASRAPVAVPFGADRANRSRLPAPSPGETTPPSRTAAANALYQADFTAATACAGFVARDSGVPKSKRGPYLQSVIDCLTEVHREPLAKVGVQVTAPKLAPADSAPGTACEEYSHADWGARYCPGDETITYRLTNQGGDDPTSDAVLIAHEFSHHIQYLTGILDDSDARVRSGFDKDEMTRREELQAACMVGVATTGPWSPVRLPVARQQSYLISIADSPADWDRTHGSGDAQQHWTKAGMAKSAHPYRACNTWTAPVNEVT